MLLDADIREPLFEFLEETYGKIRIIEEKNIGRSRADVVMITEDAICGLEIKSDADTYARLARQVKDYDKHYDYNFAVIGTTHALHIKEHIPEHWGVITVEELDGKPDFYIYKKPAPNPNVKLDYQMRMLWRPELAILQAQNDMPKYKDKSKDFVIKKLLERTELAEDNKKALPLSVLKQQMSNILMERDYSTVGSLLVEYRKGELQKQIEAEEDPEKRLALMMEQENKRKQIKENGIVRKRRRRRRRRS